MGVWSKKQKIKMGLITFLPQWVLLDVDWDPQEVFAVNLNDCKVCPGPGMEATNLYERNEGNVRPSRPSDGRESNYSRGSNCDITFDGCDWKSREGDEGLVLSSKIQLVDSSS